MLPALVVLAALLVPQDGKLKELEDAAKRKRDDRDRRPEVHAPAAADDAWSEFWGEIFVETLGWVVIYPFTDQGRRYRDYPFEEGRSYFGRGPELPYPFAFEARLDVQRVEADLLGVRGGFTLRLPSGCDLALEHTTWTEELDDGDDELALTRFELNYGFPGRSANFQASIGWGLAVLAGDGVEAAATLQAGLAWLVAEPVSVRLNFAVMEFAGATFNDLSVDLRWHVGRWALTGGWRSIFVTNGPDLDGPTLGVAAYF